MIVLEAFVYEYGLIEHTCLSSVVPIIEKLLHLTDLIQILFNGDITIKGW